jgi:hypothetical protein
MTTKYLVVEIFRNDLHEATERYGWVSEILGIFETLVDADNFACRTTTKQWEVIPVEVEDD